MPTLEYDFLREEERISNEERIVLQNDETQDSSEDEMVRENDGSVKSKYF